MHKTTVTLLIVIAVVVIGALLLISRSDDSSFPSGSVSGDNGGTTELVKKDASVNNIDILFIGSFPVQVRIIARGEFADSCTEISDVTASRSGDTFNVKIVTQRPKDLICAAVIVSFEESIDLDVENITVGTYTVEVNGVTDTFIIDASNIRS